MIARSLMQETKKQRNLMSSPQKVFFSFESSWEEIKPIVTEKTEFENGDKEKLVAPMVTFALLGFQCGQQNQEDVQLKTSL